MEASANGKHSTMQPRPFRLRQQVCERKPSPGLSGQAADPVVPCLDGYLVSPVSLIWQSTYVGSRTRRVDWAAMGAVLSVLVGLLVAVVVSVWGRSSWAELLVLLCLCVACELGHSEPLRRQAKRVSVPGMVALAAILLSGPYAGAQIYALSGIVLCVAGLVRLGDSSRTERKAWIQRMSFRWGAMVTSSAAADSRALSGKTS